MIKYLSKLYLPDKYIAMYRYTGFKNETPLMHTNLNKLIDMIKGYYYYYQPHDRYIEIEIYNIDADDMVPFDEFSTEDQVLELRKHAKLRRLFFSPKFNQLYGESFYINSNSYNIKIDYSYIYGKWKDKFKEGDVVSTTILSNDTIVNTDHKKYGKLRLKIIFTQSCILSSDMVCGFTFKIIDDGFTDFQSELFPSNYKPVISVSTLRKISG